jgi:hypothetical protein
MSSTICSGDAKRLVAATHARAAPDSAPNGNSVRPAKATLAGRINPMKPMAAQTLSNNEHSTTGELSGSVTEHRFFLSASDFALEGASASIARMCGLL